MIHERFSIPPKLDSTTKCPVNESHFPRTRSRQSPVKRSPQDVERSSHIVGALHQFCEHPKTRETPQKAIQLSFITIKHARNIPVGGLGTPFLEAIALGLKAGLICKDTLSIGSWIKEWKGASGKGWGWNEKLQAGYDSRNWV